MTLPTVKTADKSDQDRLVDTLMFAFVADPFARFMGPDASLYMNRAVFDAMAAASVDVGGACLAYNVDGVCGAASLWFPPGHHAPDDEMQAALESMVPEDRLETTGAVFESMESYHPEEDHWYLAILGADAHFQGQGLGAALLKHTLAIADENHQPAYLESSNPRNISIYERHGFEIMDEIRIGECPVITPMLRPAR